MKQVTTTILTAIILAFCSSMAAAEIIPTFSPSEFIYWGTGQIIQTEKNGVIPNVGDWNGDGMKDILVGVYQSGNIYYYPNTGTNENPVFPSRSLLEADNRPITLTYG